MRKCGKIVPISLFMASCLSSGAPQSANSGSSAKTADAGIAAQNDVAGQTAGNSDGAAGPDANPTTKCAGAALFETKVTTHFSEAASAVLAHPDGTWSLAVTSVQKIGALSKSGILHLAADGTQLWRHDYAQVAPNTSVPMSVTARGLMLRADASLVLLSGASLNTIRAAYIRIVDPFGSDLEDELSESGSDQDPYSLMIDGQGQVIMAGQVRVGGGDSQNLAQLVSFGNKKFQVFNPYLQEGGYSCAFRSVIAGPNATMTAAGHCTGVNASNGGEKGVFIANVDGKGAENWHVFNQVGSTGWANAIAPAPMAGYAVTGAVQNPQTLETDGLLLFTDDQGQELRHVVFPHSVSDEFFAILPLPAGGYILAGRTATKTNSDGWLVRTDGFGNRQWERTFGGENYDSLRAVALAGNDGLALAGIADQTSKGASAGFFARTDSFGHQQCQAAGVCGAKGWLGCDDADPCTADDCDAVAGCVHSKLADGASCGPDSHCKLGVCAK